MSKDKITVICGYTNSANTQGGDVTCDECDSLLYMSQSSLDAAAINLKISPMDIDDPATWKKYVNIQCPKCMLKAAENMDQEDKIGFVGPTAQQLMEVLKALAKK